MTSFSTIRRRWPHHWNDIEWYLPSYRAWWARKPSPSKSPCDLPVTTWFPRRWVDGGIKILLDSTIEDPWLVFFKRKPRPLKKLYSFQHFFRREGGREVFQHIAKHTFSWYCWWFRNPDSQLRLVVYTHCLQGFIHVRWPRWTVLEAEVLGHLSCPKHGHAHTLTCHHNEFGGQSAASLPSSQVVESVWNEKDIQEFTLHATNILFKRLLDIQKQIAVQTLFTFAYTSSASKCSVRGPKYLKTPKSRYRKWRAFGGGFPFPQRLEAKAMKPESFRVVLNDRVEFRKLNYQMEFCLLGHFCGENFPN